jgi:hypothetical protein
MRIWAMFKEFHTSYTMDDTGLCIERAQARGIVGNNPIQYVWHILTEIDHMVPWQTRYQGSPNVFDVWKYVALDLKNIDIHIYRYLKVLIGEIATYDYVNFYLLR